MHLCSLTTGPWSGRPPEGPMLPKLSHNKTLQLNIPPVLFTSTLCFIFAPCICISFHFPPSFTIAFVCPYQKTTSAPIIGRSLIEIPELERVNEKKNERGTICVCARVYKFLARFIALFYSLLFIELIRYDTVYLQQTLSHARTHAHTALQ